jgi:hypothetical protein
MKTDICGLAWLELGRGVAMALLENGKWAIRGREEVIEMSSDDDYFRTSLLLELPYKELQRLVGSFPLTHADAKSFPYLQIAKYGLTSKNDNLAVLAIDWVVDFPQEKQGKLAKELRELSEARWAHQQSRQKARRILRNLQTKR